MKETLDLVAQNKGETWDFFREITEQFIKCLSGSSNYINEFEDELPERYKCI